MPTNGHEKMIEKFEDRNLFQEKSGKGRKPIASMAVEHVTTALQE